MSAWNHNSSIKRIEKKISHNEKTEKLKGRRYTLLEKLQTLYTIWFASSFLWINLFEVEDYGGNFVEDFGKIDEIQMILKLFHLYISKKPY
jgi:hypothetical protein